MAGERIEKTPGNGKNVWIIAGVVLFCKHVKKIRLYPGSSGLTSGQKCRLLMLNPGSIVYELLVLGLIALTVLV